VEFDFRERKAGLLTVVYESQANRHANLFYIQLSSSMS